MKHKKPKLKLNLLLIALLATGLSTSSFANTKSKDISLIPTANDLKQMPFFMKKGYSDGLYKIKGIEHIKPLGVTAFAVHSDKSGDGLFFAKNGYMFVGNIMDPNGVSVTEQISKKYATPIDYADKAHFLKDAKTIKFGEGKKEAFVFVDPLCPHCVQRVLTALKAKSDSLAKEYTIHFVFVGFVAPYSKSMAEYIYKNAKSLGGVASAWEKALSIKSSFKPSDLSPDIDVNMGVMRNMGINSTPTTIVHNNNNWSQENNLFNK